jgi:tetratricopeptide (TPR) repeat protein
LFEVRFRAGWRAAAAVAVLAAGAMAAEPPPPETPSAAPATQASQQARRLIEQLGDKDYFVRQHAEEQLARLGFEAFDALCDAAVSGDLEVAARARRLLALMKIHWADKNDPPAVKQILREYELQNVAGRRTAMASLARLPEGAGAGALCRLVRYEKSTVLSKYAAVLLLGDFRAAAPLLGDLKATAPPQKALADLIAANLASSRRPAALWLLTWARSATDPRAMGDPWSRLVDAEQTLWQGSPAESDRAILLALRHVQVAWLRKLGRTDELIAAAERLMQIDNGDPKTLGSLLEWLTEQKDWKDVDRLAEQFAAQIAEDANLLYAVAAARADRGDTTRAEAFARRAFALYPGNDPENLQRHLMLGFSLQQRGRFAWAKREYRYFIASSPPIAYSTLAAEHQLAEMLHDQGADREAGEVLRRMVRSVDVFHLLCQAIGIRRSADAVVVDARLNEIRARRDYCFVTT